MDNQYWNNYYKKNLAPKEASNFAWYIMKYLEKNKFIIELGCGNGRDSLFFTNNGINVLAIDQSEAIIDDLKVKNKYKNIKFIQDDFVNSKLLDEIKVDYVYSRFTIHSITEEDEEKLIKRVYNCLKNKGMFFIEVRSVKDELYGLGEKIARNAYIYDDHYRRFIVIDELVKNLEKNGFKIILAQESRDWAIYKDSNPIIIRIIAKK
ncbi:class I SAM-dependent methyltransferase [Paraclostridium bifermentans]|uniref:class I SAM-dependent methyltransferase n=1 Tax=Paraclostridium bifermentans TaxID=1490 RepID=UPI001A9AAAD8|nr:class I SAM-dependent methyltransferase [Paraclostridium bifermentans]